MGKSCKHTPLKKYKFFEKFNSSISKHIHFGKNNLDSINEKSSYFENYPLSLLSFCGQLHILLESQSS